jgi:hypothetical protein
MGKIWMEKHMSKLKPLAAVALLMLVSAVTDLGTATAPAYASGPPSEICGNAGTGYCLNDWNGTTGDVKMYYGGYANDYFWLQPAYICGGGNTVEGAPYYCPFSNHALDDNLAGRAIDEIGSGVNPGWCVGSAANNSLTILQPCGSGTGTIFVLNHASCPPSGLEYVNRYWSNHYNTAEYLESGNALGAEANEDYSGPSPTCWQYG